MPIDSKECFAALTEDGQLWEIYQAAQTGGGGGAPTNASYVVISNDPTLTDERVLTQGTNIAITDGGANNPVTVATVLDPTFDSVQIDTTPSAPVTPAVGKIAWNDTDGTLEFGLKGGNVDLQIGQENILLVKNDQGAPLAKGEVVYISGGNGTNLLVKKAQANSDTTSASTIGLVAEPLAINGQGFITTFGVIKNVNTNAFNDGDILYLSPTTPGAVTNVKPSAPNHLVLVGFVQKKSAGAGEIFVEIQNGYELEELHNVQINSGTLANNDLLAYNSATLTWQNKTVASAGGITSVSGTSPISASTVSGAVTVTTSIATNRIVGRSTAGTGVMEQLTPVGITVSAGNITGIGGTVGTVDNAVPRADGTGGYTVQGSDIVIDDAVPFLSGVTGLDSTDYITVVGNTFVANQQIFFGSLTGGSALVVNTPYFVRDVGGAGANTFRISATSGGGTLTLGSNITAGTVGAAQTNVAIVNNHAGQTNSALVLTPKGTGALIAGPKPDGTTTGGNARGDHATDFQTFRTAASEVASGTRAAILGGQQNTCSGNRSFIGAGEANTVSERNSAIASGLTNSTGTSQRSFIGCGESNSTTANNTGILSGHHARADRLAMQSHASGQFSANGDAQRARFVLRCKTTTNAAVEMALDGSTTYLGIPSGKVMSCLINISGVKSDGSAVAHYVRQYAVKNVGGTSSEVYAPVTIGTDNAAGTVIALSANNTDDTLRIAVTGIAAETWRWVASVDAVEIAYGT